MAGFSSIMRKLEAPHPAGVSNTQMFLINDDLLPVPPHERTWRWYNYISFWLADSFNINTFMIASSGVGLGLNWWQAWLSIWVGYGLAAFFLVLNAYPGGKYHLIFPAYCRASFEAVGSLWIVFNRAAMACIWYGVQAWIGGECMYTLLRAIWPSTVNVANGIPSSGTDTMHFVSFFLFWFLSLIPIWFPLHQIKVLFDIKAVVASIGGIALFSWSIARAGGIQPIINQPATVSGSELGWTFVVQLMSCISNMATLIVNALDFASRAHKPSNTVLPQAIALPVSFAVTSFFGILISGSSYAITGGTFIWSPLDLMDYFLDLDPQSSRVRAGVAIISICFLIAQLGTNIAANSVSAGCDLTALCPRFITIRRGGYVAALVGLCMCPWNLLKDSNSFTTYLSAYSVLLSSVAGVLITHYYIVAKRRIKVDDLYTFEKGSYYRYFYGINWKAYAAYIGGIVINAPGLAGAVGNDVPLAATRIYNLSFFTGFGVAMVLYIALNYFFPSPLPTEEECAEENVTMTRDNVGHGGIIKRSSYDEGTDEEEKAEKASS